MFRLEPQMTLAARAGGFGENSKRRAAKTISIGVAEAIWLGLIGALFVLWAISSSVRQSEGWSASSSSGCVSFGRGGVICDGPATNADRRTATKGSDASCVSFGRGGRYCTPATHDK
jgi:hypothetical protein